MTIQAEGGVIEFAANPELGPIDEICTGYVRYMTEGELRYIFMGGLCFIAKGKRKQMDALLCLNYPNPTYPTRLYLTEKLGLNLNWNETVSILARQWHTWSWKDVSSTLSPIDILACHLGAFK